MKNYVYILLLAFLGISACKKEVDPYVETLEQFGRDTVLINDFIQKNSIPAIKDTNGIYYQIIEPGTGSNLVNGSIIKVKYKARLLNGNVFDSTEPDSTAMFRYPGNLIAGWVIGLPNIREGGKIRLLIPSFYAYRREKLPGVPANSVLDFDIELLEINR